MTCTRQFYMLVQNCSKQLLLKVYYGICHSKLCYGLICWGSTDQSKLNQIIVTQKYIIRIICKKKRRDNTFELFKDLNVLPVKHQYYYLVLRKFYTSGSNISNRYISSYQLRMNNFNLVYIPNHNLQCLLSCYTFLAPRIFNVLPIAIRQINGKTRFLNDIRIWLFDHDHNQVNNIIQILQ